MLIKVMVMCCGGWAVWSCGGNVVFVVVNVALVVVLDVVVVVVDVVVVVVEK